MKNWVINSATIVGRDHILTKKNRQDFLVYREFEDLKIGVVCDGCGEGEYSEVGASLIGTFTLNFLLNHFKPNVLPVAQAFLPLSTEYLEQCITFFIKSLSIMLYERQEILFVKDFMLSTCLFCVIDKENITIGYCGDGVIIINDKARILDQKGAPHYIAYKNIPKEALEKQPTSLNFFTIETYKQSEIEKVVIGSDGVVPIVESSIISQLQLYGTKKRQLQRKFNIWHEEKLFCDDATCIVFESANEKR